MKEQHTDRSRSDSSHSVGRLVLQESSAEAISSIGRVLATVFSNVRPDGKPRQINLDQPPAYRGGEHREKLGG